MGVPKDYPRAVSLFEKACDDEFAAACTGLGQMYRDGKGVAQDDTNASSLSERGCDLGDLNGCLFGVVHHDPLHGSVKDSTRWAASMEKGCDLGAGNLCRLVGSVYALGVFGLAKDADRANELFKKGCLHDDKEACDLIKR